MSVVAEAAGRGRKDWRKAPSRKRKRPPEARKTLVRMEGRDSRRRRRWAGLCRQRGWGGFEVKVRGLLYRVAGQCF